MLPNSVMPNKNPKPMPALKGTFLSSRRWMTGSSAYNSHTTSTARETPAMMASVTMKDESNHCSRSPRSRNSCRAVSPTPSRMMPGTSMRARVRCRCGGSSSTMIDKPIPIAPSGRLI